MLGLKKKLPTAPKVEASHWHLGGVSPSPADPAQTDTSLGPNMGTEETPLQGILGHFIDSKKLVAF